VVIKPLSRRFVLVLKKHPMRTSYTINMYSILIGQFWRTRTKLVPESFTMYDHQAWSNIYVRPPIYYQTVRGECAMKIKNCSLQYFLPLIISKL